jgi:hypothetical protein
MPNTETLDKLYLEWSQFTKARTKRELFLIDTLQRIREKAEQGETVPSAYIRQLTTNQTVD